MERGHFQTRSRAQAAVLAGRVRVAGRSDLKAGTMVPTDAEIEVTEPLRYVSRGGLKLEAGLEAFGVSPRGRVCIDVGASTGGFTDCLLQNGAKRVYAVDVGRGQIDARLRSDPRVVLMERTNARYLEPSLFPEPPGLATVDVSFISLAKILPPLVLCLRRPFDILALVKPQFELGPKETPKGIVRDEKARRRAVDAVEACAEGLGLISGGSIPSPVKGAKGNVEFLSHFRSP